MTPYLIIGVIGLLVLAVSLVVGEVLEGVLDGVGGDWFSTEVVGAFVAAFGFGGALALGAGAPGLVALPVGLVTGAGFAAGAAWFSGLVRGGGSEQPATADDLVGYDARVVAEIPAEGYGVVTLLRGEQVIRMNARAELALEPGTRVHVTGVLSPTAVSVAPLWNTLDPS